MIFALLAAALTSPAAPSRPPVTTLEATSLPAPLSAPGTEVAKDHLPLAELPDDRLTVEVTLAGTGPFRFLVDTGSDRSAISRQLAERLGLAPGRPLNMHSVTGLSTARTARVNGLKVASRSLPEVTAPLLEAQHVRADGILGTDALSAALVRFDFRKGLLSIASGRAHYRRFDEEDTIVVQARRRAGRLIVTEASVGSQQVTVVIDTGSELTIGNAALRKALSRRGRLGEAQQIELTSVTGDKLMADYISLDRVEIGGIGLEDLGVAFADAHTFDVMGLAQRPALLLGMNALRAFDSVTIDMAEKKLRFVPPAAEAERTALRALR